MMCDHFISPSSAMGSPGVDELRWLRPVRPGDRLKARVTVLQTRRSHSEPDRGSIVLMQELMDYAGAVVMMQRGRALYRCRRPGTSTLATRESKLT
jgi:acyl dehydratase